MTSLAQRLEEGLTHAGIGPYRLAEDAQVDIGTVTRVLKGERERLEHTTLARLAKRLGVRLEWLSLGDGPMVEVIIVGRLRDRPEWTSMVGAVEAMHPELAKDHLWAVGEMYDHPDIWPGPLDAAAIAALAAIHRDWLAREAARRR